MLKDDRIAGMLKLVYRLFWALKVRTPYGLHAKAVPALIFSYVSFDALYGYKTC